MESSHYMVSNNNQRQKNYLSACSEQASGKLDNEGFYSYPNKCRSEVVVQNATYEEIKPREQEGLDLINLTGAVLVGIILMAHRPLWLSLWRGKLNKKPMTLLLLLLLWIFLQGGFLSIVWIFLKLTFFIPLLESW